MAAGSLALSAQTLAERVQAAPPEIEDALRARIKLFFDMQAEGKFRQAEAMVAEDSKDRYYSMDKDRVEGFDLVKLVWEENNTKARAVATRFIRMMVPMSASGVKIKGTFTTFWKLENGLWCWYLPPEPDFIDTPFGKMRNRRVGGPDGGPTSGPDLAAANEKAAKQAMAVAQNMKTAVKTDRTVLWLRAWQASQDTLTITNELPGGASLRAEMKPIPGLEIKLGKKDLAAKESTQLVVSYKPGDKTKPPAMAELQLRVEPTQQVILITLNIELTDNSPIPVKRRK